MCHRLVSFWSCRGLNVEVDDVFGVFLDEFLSGLDVFTHEDGEDLVGSNGVVEGNPAQRSGFWIHGRLPELVRVHFAQTLEPGDIDLHIGIAAAQFAGNLVALLV